MSIMRRPIASLDTRASPYFYVPPKRRWWPFLAAFAAGGACVLALFGPAYRSDGAGAAQRPTAYQVTPGNSTTVNSPAKPSTRRASRDPGEVALTPPGSVAAQADPRNQPRVAEPGPPPPEAAMASVRPDSPSVPAATEIETTPPNLAAPQAHARQAKASRAQRHAKRSRRHEPAEAYARDYDTWGYAGFGTERNRSRQRYGYWGDRNGGNFGGSRGGWSYGFN